MRLKRSFLFSHSSDRGLLLHFPLFSFYFLQWLVSPLAEVVLLLFLRLRYDPSPPLSVISVSFRFAMMDRCSLNPFQFFGVLGCQPSNSVSCRPGDFHVFSLSLIHSLLLKIDSASDFSPFRGLLPCRCGASILDQDFDPRSLAGSYTPPFFEVSIRPAAF